MGAFVWKSLVLFFCLVILAGLTGIAVEAITKSLLILCSFLFLIWFRLHYGTWIPDGGKARRAKAELTIEKCRGLIQTHWRELERNRTTQIGYGKFDERHWRLEKVKFIQHVLRAGIRESALLEDSCLDALIEQELQQAKLRPKPKTARDIQSWEDFERYCEEILTQAGWAVTMTKATGDQGGDLLATRNGLSVVVQCKFYSKPVGNSAVQEAYSAMGFYSADAAVVVSNAGFTQSAIELATATTVTLTNVDGLLSL